MSHERTYRRYNSKGIKVFTRSKNKWNSCFVFKNRVNSDKIYKSPEQSGRQLVLVGGRNMKLIIIIVTISLIGGGLLGYAVTSFWINGPEIETLQTQVDELGTNVTNLEGTVTEQATQLLDLDAELSDAEAETAHYAQQTTDLQSQVSTLQTDLNTARDQVTYYQDQIALLQSQSSDSQELLSTVLGITVIQNYTWFYQYRNWNCDLPVLLSIYIDFLERPRPTIISSYVNMATDPDDDLFINSVIQELDEVALEYHLDEAQKLELVITLVQSIAYTDNNGTAIADEYPCYPIETIFNRGGNCEDTSILLAALLDAMGYDVALLYLDEAQYMAVGIALPGAYGQYYEYNGKQYFYIETTKENWPIGQISLDLASTHAYVYPLRD
jgi:hypothetical protein